jgi:hypothetical protein
VQQQEEVGHVSMQINFFLASMTSGAYELHPNPMNAVLIRR